MLLNFMSTITSELLYVYQFMDQETERKPASCTTLFKQNWWDQTTLIPNMAICNFQLIFLYCLCMFLPIRLSSSQTHSARHLIFQMCFVPSVLFHTASLIKEALLNRNPAPTPVFSEPLPSSFLTLWILQLFSHLLSLLWKVKGKKP